MRNRLLEKTDHYEDDTTTVTVDESSLNDAAPPAIAVEFVLRSRESLAGRHYKESETFIGSNESLLPAPMPKATSNRSIEQRKVTAEPVIAAQAAPPLSMNKKHTCSSGCSDRTTRSAESISSHYEGNSSA